MLEAGNMRDSGDAAVMTSATGQERYARALALHRYDEVFDPGHRPDATPGRPADPGPA
jgi:hypothetical protein